GWFSGEDNPAGTGNNVVNGIGVIDKGTVLAGIRAALAFPNPLQATTNGCCSDLEQRVNTVLEIGGSFAERDSSTSLNGITSGRDRFGFPFADPNNTGVSLGDPNASVDMTNKRELEFAEATAAFWWRLFSSPGLGQSLFGIGGAVSNLDMEESVRYMVNAPAFAPGRFDGTYDHDSDTDCGRFWGGAQTRLGATANTQLRVRGELGVTACDTDLRHTAVFNDTGAVLSETSTSFSDSENAFYAKGELALDINLQNIFGAGAKATVHGAVSTGDILVPTLDVAAGTGVIDWENPLNTEVGVTVSIPLGPQQSDRRLKRDIAHVATLENGIRLYAFRYLWDDQLHIGVMAQDLRADETFKDAVVLKPNGFYAVDYGKLGLKMTTLEAWREYGLASVMARPVSGGASASLTQPLR
ncbi:MAG: tail fiber domain-containing protein, partial [Hyphomicrobiales bacterium]|nr:tail fiber domain-containing protein [Hyphomicrobiales bacterium]